MSLCQFIRDNTNDGRNIASLLIDVMEGRLDGAKPGHRLTAARLPIIYGYEDADDSIAANTSDASGREQAEKRWVLVDPALTTLIKLSTDDGRAMVLFLIDVMEGRAEGANVGHRVSAARELLNRAFGKSRSRDLPKPPGSAAPERQTRKTHQRIASTQPQSVTTAPAASTAVLEQPEPHPEESRTSSIAPIYIDSEPFYLDSDLLMAFDGCEDPNFDPYRAIHDEEYARSYAGCKDPECEVHGEPKEFDFDPNDYHY